ncbi:MAG: hypothetical protein H0Z33_17205 [Bacillaceae bacterium]|nr:hypothetical protein [Bacillaceae bacterium]
MKLSRLQKGIAAFAGVILVVQAFLFTIQGMGSGSFAGAEKMIKENADDQRIAAELSNMTGVSVEQILTYRQNGLTWNEVIDILKTNSDDLAENPSERNSRLVSTGLDQIDIQKLKEQGFSEQDITSAKLLVERTVFQLNQIVDSEAISPDPVIQVEDPLEQKEDNLAAYKQIIEKFDIKKAVYLILKLNPDFGSMEAVLDEYLLSLQLDMDLELYIRDREKYEEEKENKILTLTDEEIITLARIDDKMLEVINKNQKETESEQVEADSNAPVIEEEDKNDPLPDIPSPDIEEIKPANPAEEIMEEIRVLDPNQNY